MLQIGIVGLPNVGKSTLFNVLTKSHGAESANYPFCTIEPNVGQVEVPDSRLTQIANIVQPEKCIPTMIEFVDIAGLIKGAAQGEGLGNKFLDNIRKCDAIVHVVRSFEDSNVHHVHGDVNAKDDIEVINTELVLADFDSVLKQKTTWEKKAKSGDKEAKTMMQLIDKVTPVLEAGAFANTVEINEEEAPYFHQMQLITGKPFIYGVNVSENELSNDNHALSDTKYDEASVIPFCAKLEQDLLDMSDEEANEFLGALGVQSSGLDRLIQMAYQKLGLISFFTAGPKEVRAWTVHKGDTAPNAAGVIHSDFEKKFIRAEVIAWDSFVSYGSEKAAKDAGAMRTEGKDYIVQDGDIMHFLHGA